MELDRDKLKGLVHYIATAVRHPDDLGAIKLNKVLWYADMNAYLVLGESITGETYVKRQYGPAPKHIVPIVEDLMRSGRIIVQEVNYFGDSKREYISLRDPDVSLFTSEEISIVEEAIRYVCYRHTATSISDKTHGMIWDLAEMGEEMPYHTAFVMELGEIDETDIDWAHNSLQA